MKISPADKRTFESVMAHHGLDPDEIELCKRAYRNDPPAGRITYAALATEIPKPVDALPWVVLSPPAKGAIKRA